MARANILKEAFIVPMHTRNLQAGPTRMREVVSMARSCGLQIIDCLCYLNFYNRFSVGFVHRYPRVVRLLAGMGSVCGGVPGLRLAVIAFMLPLRREVR